MIRTNRRHKYSACRRSFRYLWGPLLCFQSKQSNWGGHTFIFRHSTNHLRRSVCCSCHRFLNPSGRQIGKRCSSRKKHWLNQKVIKRLRQNAKKKKTLKLKWWLKPTTEPSHAFLFLFVLSTLFDQLTNLLTVKIVFNALSLGQQFIILLVVTASPYIIAHC